jgi:hypothetical protein
MEVGNFGGFFFQLPGKTGKFVVIDFQALTRYLKIGLI